MVASGVDSGNLAEDSGVEILYCPIDLRHQAVKGWTPDFMDWMDVASAMVVTTDGNYLIYLFYMARESEKRHRSPSTLADDNYLVTSCILNSFCYALVLLLVGFAFICPIHRYEGYLRIFALPFAKCKTPQYIVVITKPRKINDVSHNINDQRKS